MRPFLSPRHTGLRHSHAWRAMVSLTHFRTNPRPTRTVLPALLKPSNRPDHDTVSENRAPQKRTKPSHMLAFVLFSTMAMLSKEQGITVLGFAPVYDLAIRCQLPPSIWLSMLIRRQAPDWVVQLRKRILLSVVAGILLLTARFLMMGEGVPIFQPKELPHRFHPSLLVRFLSQNWLVVFNFNLLLFPLTLCSDWSYGSVPLLLTASDPRVVGIIFLYAVLAHRLYKLWGSQEPHSLIELTAWGMMVLSFLPASGLLFTVGFVVAERVLYLPR